MMSKARAYQDFVLELRDFDTSNDSYTVALSPAQKWGDAPPVRTKLDGGEVFKKALAKLDSKNIYIEDLISFGKWLADHLLPEGPIRQHFISAVRAVGDEGGIRLRLVSQQFKLQQIPWEYTYLPLESGTAESGNFLVLYGHVSLVRYLPMDAPPPDLQPVDPTRLRLLTVSASPKSEFFHRLDLERDRAVFHQILSQFNVEGLEIEWLPYIKDATIGELEKALLQKPHLFHFSGHGVYEQRDDSASLVFLKDRQTKAPSYLSSADLAKKLRTAGARLVILGACDTGRLRGATPWTGIAPALNIAGIPAVVAMQFKFLDRKCGPFLHAFYSALAAGLSLDEAVTTGRLALWESSEEAVFEWGIPILYLRSEDGILFPELSQRQTSLADRLRDAVRINVNQNSKTGIVRGLSIDELVGPLPELFLALMWISALIEMKAQ